jgi:putative phosphoserine phosphatase/1-acylglycerol-3-phosphate O-acyltransferase
MAESDLGVGLRTGPVGPTVGAIFDYQALMDQSRRSRSSAASCFAAEWMKWANRPEDELREIGVQRFRDELAGDLFHGAWRLVRRHLSLGHSVVLMATEPRFVAEPLARELGIKHVVCTEYAVSDRVLSAYPDGPLLVGQAKLAALRALADRQGIDLSCSHAYAHTEEDLPILESVGHAHPVNPQPALARRASTRGWTSIQFKTPAAKYAPLPAIRTAAMFGSLLAAAGAGIGIGAATRNRRRGVDLATTVFGRVGTVLGDIEVDITGTENIWSSRPAVFFANHQSTMMDILLMSRIVQRGFTFVAKAEARSMPVVGSLFEMADVAFVDRASTSNAIAALEPAGRKLRGGTSIAISPEGTRSLTPAVGAFKKGGFHLARDAGVPIVPIVIRNAGEIMWRNARVAQSGVVEVMVHQPVPTAAWAREDIGPWLTRMHQLYIDTLDDWPGIAAGQRWSAAIAEAARRGS